VLADHPVAYWRLGEPVIGASASPASVPGLMAWYDFSDASTLYKDAGVTLVTADGDAIYQANDKSGNSYHAVQATLANRPLYKTAIQNGRSVGRSDGTNDSLVTSAMAHNIGTGPYTLFVVAEASSTVGHRDLLNIAPNLEWLVSTGVTNVFSNATGSHLLNTYIGTTAFHSMQLRRASNVITGYIDGVAEATTVPNSENLTNSAVGLGLTAAGQSWFGDFAEVLIYNNAISAADHLLLGNYLASKWGLAWPSTAYEVNGTYPGTYTGVTSGVTGALRSDPDTAGLFAGAGHVALANASDLAYSVGTVEAWVKAAAPGASYRGIVVKRNAYSLFLQDGVLGAYDWNAAALRDTTVNIADGAWHHVVFTFNSGTTNNVIYIDGRSRLSGFSYTVNAQDVALAIGAGDPAGVVQAITGSIDEVAIYNIALSAARILAHYAAQEIGVGRLVSAGSRGPE
jgi:hypothetical protein